MGYPVSSLVRSNFKFTSKGEPICLDCWSRWGFRMKTRAKMIDVEGESLCIVEIDGGTLRSAVQAAVGRLIHTADANADLNWTHIEIYVNRWMVDDDGNTRPAELEGSNRDTKEGASNKGT